MVCTEAVPTPFGQTKELKVKVEVKMVEEYKRQRRKDGIGRTTSNHCASQIPEGLGMASAVQL